MTITPPSENPNPTSPAPAEPGFEVAVQSFWEKNRGLIFALCGIALAVIVGREGWQFFAAQREKSLRDDYAKVADKPDQLASFAAANSSHTLGGVAFLKLADAKYAAGDFRAAADNYKKASEALKSPAFSGRARLGAAMSQLNNGDKAGAETALKAIAADAALPKSLRAEASYHLATVAHEAGNAAEVSRLVGEITKLDGFGVWAQQAAALEVAK